MYLFKISEQAFWTDADTVLITTYSIILITIELAKLNKYKLPSKERHNLDLEDRVNQSANDLLSMSQRSSDIDEKLLRKNALDRIMKNLDINSDNNEDVFGDRLPSDIENPKMRYSIQDPKHPFYADTEEQLDGRRTESEPAIKFKDYDGVNSERDYNRLLNDLADTKDEVSVDPKDEQPAEEYHVPDRQSTRFLIQEPPIEETKTPVDEVKAIEDDKNAEEEKVPIEESPIEEPGSTPLKDKVLVAEDKKDTFSESSEPEKSVHSEEEKKLDITEDDKPDEEGFTQYNATAEPDNLSPDPKLNNIETSEKEIISPDSREGDLTQERMIEDNEENEDIYNERGNQEVEKALELDGDSDNIDNDDDNLDNDEEIEDSNQLKRTLSEKEQPLEEVIKRNEDFIGVHAKSETADDKIQIASDDRGSKETSNGVLETPPPEDSDGFDADAAAIEMNKQQQKPKVFYSDKSESSVEEMMADTPSNYNIPNGRFDDRSKGLKGMHYGGIMDKYGINTHRDKSSLTRPKLDIITEVEAPTKAPSNLNTIKHVKTTKNERHFIDSVLGSEKNSYMGDVMANSIYRKGGESDRGPGSDHDPIPRHHDIRRHSKSNVRNDFPTKSLEDKYNLQKRLKYNQFMMSNQDSDNSSALEGLGFDNRSYVRDKPNDPDLTKEIKSSLPPLRYPKIKPNPKKNPKKLKLKENKNLATTNINDLESAYLSGSNFHRQSPRDPK